MPVGRFSSDAASVGVGAAVGSGIAVGSGVGIAGAVGAGVDGTGVAVVGV